MSLIFDFTSLSVVDEEKRPFQFMLSRSGDHKLGVEKFVATSRLLYYQQIERSREPAQSCSFSGPGLFLVEKKTHTAAIALFNEQEIKPHCAKKPLYLYLHIPTKNICNNLEEKIEALFSFTSKIIFSGDQAVGVSLAEKFIQEKSVFEIFFQSDSVNVEPVVKLAKCCTNTKILDLKDSFRIQDEHLKDICSSCPDIMHLDISYTNCQKWPPKLKNLQKLIAKNIFFSTEGITTAFPKLLEFSIGEDKEWEKVYLPKQISDYKEPRSLSSNKKASEIVINGQLITTDYLTKLFQLIPNITNIVFETCVVAPKSFLVSFPASLTSVTFNGTIVADEEITDLCINCLTLSSLAFIRCDKTTLTTLQSVFSLPENTFYSLSIEGCREISPVLEKTLLFHRKNSQEVVIECDEKVDIELLDFIFHFYLQVEKIIVHKAFLLNEVVLNTLNNKCKNFEKELIIEVPGFESWRPPHFEA